MITTNKIFCLIQGGPFHKLGYIQTGTLFSSSPGTKQDADRKFYTTFITITFF